MLRSKVRLALAFGALAALAACARSSSETDESDLEAGHGTSYAALAAKIHAEPLATLPEHSGLAAWDIVQNLVGSEDKPRHGLSVRSRRIFVDDADESRDPEAKWLHPRGACATARWTIDEDSPATGLFSKGTRVPAIIRVSSGDKVSEGGEAAGGRILGLAVKLFPVSSDTQVVKTRNIIMLDAYGFERSKRLHTWEEDNGDPVYFTNVAPARSALGRFLSTFFDRFDNPNFARPVYATARASIGGGELLESVTPYEIRFRSRRSATPPPAELDFRAELQRTPETTLDIIIHSFDGRSVVDKTIGRLELGKFTVSDYCDRRLRFHHDPIEDQLEKYSDYEVVSDLLEERRGR